MLLGSKSINNKENFFFYSFVQNVLWIIFCVRKYSLKEEGKSTHKTSVTKVDRTNQYFYDKFVLVIPELRRVEIVGTHLVK